MAAPTKEMQVLRTKAAADAAKVTLLKKEREKAAEAVATGTATQAAIAAQNVESEGGPKAYERWADAEAELDKKRRHLKYLGIQLQRAEEVEAQSADALRGAEASAVIDRWEDAYGVPGTENTFLGHLSELERGLGIAVTSFRKAIEFSEKRLQPSFSGDLPMIGLGLKAGEMIQAIQAHLFRVGSQPFIGGSPGARAPVNFPGGKCPDHRLMGLPDKVPSLTAHYLDLKNFAVDIQRGVRRFDGKEPDTPAPAQEGQWAQPGPSIAPAAETPGKAPHIEGLKAAPADDDLADILGPAPPPAPVAVPKPQAGKFFDPTTKTWVRSSVSGDPYTLEELAQMELENFRKSPKGYPPPTRKVRLD